LIVSASKVAKGDATFSTSKCILGWNVDTHRMTIHLPEHRLHRLQSVVENTLWHALTPPARVGASCWGNCAALCRRFTVPSTYSPCSNMRSLPLQDGAYASTPSQKPH
jgi:hypothetical protein